MERQLPERLVFSFLLTAKRFPASTVEEQLRMWITTMIDKKMSISTRKRYVEKLSTLYKDFAGGAAPGDSPFNIVRPLRDL